MKQNSFLMTGFLLMIMFFACKKNPIDPPSDPPPSESTKRVIRLVLTNLPDQPDAIENLKAIVTIKNSRNEVVRSNKVLSVQYNQKYITDTITLSKGNFTITGLLVKQGDTAVRFASPIAGSAKAAGVTRPLNINITLDEKIEKNIDVEVLPVTATDTPESFGYPAGSFGNRPGDPETPMDKQIFVRTLIKVGDVVYDSLPVQLILKSWDAQNNMDYKAISLPAGLQPVMLRANAVRYQLSVSKWNTYDEMVLTKDDVQENTVYIIGGNKAARKLKSVIESKIINGKSTPQYKFEYVYQANGELKEMLQWGKRNNLTTYLVRKNIYEYQQSRITGIRSYDENAALLATSVYSYNAEGRISHLEKTEAGQKLNGNVHYLPLEGSTGISNYYSVQVEYTHSDHYYKTYLSRDIYGGNPLSDVISTSHGNSESGLYEHDFSINPYVHLNIPDVFLNYNSKHNLKRQWKTWVNNFPLYEPIEFKYTYDAEGYPTQLLTSYRDYQTKAEVFTIRTVFDYY